MTNKSKSGYSYVPHNHPAVGQVRVHLHCIHGDQRHLNSLFGVSYSPDYGQQREICFCRYHYGTDCESNYGECIYRIKLLWANFLIGTRAHVDCMVN